MLTIDNRDMNEVDRYQTARIEALKKRVKELEKQLSEKPVDAVASRRLVYYDHAANRPDYSKGGILLTH